MQQLSAQDAQFLYMETNTSLSHVVSVSIFDPSTAPGGKVRFKQIIDHVSSRLHTSPIYKRRIYHVPLELDYPYWINDEHFDIEYHMQHGRLPHPSDWRQLCIHLARFHSRPLDMQRAPWEMLVIEGLDAVEGIPKGCYAIAIKIHHAAADGVAIVKFLGGLLDIDAFGTPVMNEEPTVNSIKYEKPSNLQMSARGLISAIRSPVKIADALMQNAPAIVQAARKRFRDDQKEAKRSVPNTRFNRETTPHKVFDATVFSLADFKPIRRLAEGSTINDVVLAISSGALRKYLQHHKELPSQSLKAFAPVNVRDDKNGSTGDDQPGNNISTMAPELYTNVQDPVERLAAIHNETKNHKAAKKGLSARLMTDVTRHIPASTQLLAARMLMSSDVSSRMTNVCISNVPGPAVPVYMNGAKSLGTLALGPLADRMGLFIAVTSYNGMMSFNVTSCRRTMPDIDLFMTFIRDSFAELKAAAAKLPKATRNKKPVKKAASLKKISAKKRTTKTSSSSLKKRATKTSARATTTTKAKTSKKVTPIPKNRKKRSKKS